MEMVRILGENMRVLDYNNMPWNVYVEEWGHEGIPKDQYRLQKGIMDVFIPVRVMEDEEFNGRPFWMVEFFAVDKWRQAGRPAYKPIKKLTKYYIEHIVTSIGSNVGHVHQALLKGNAREANIWLSIVSYD